MDRAINRTPSLIERLIFLLITPAKGGRQKRRRRVSIDLRHWPDHLKWDVGILDGRGTGVRRK